MPQADGEALELGVLGVVGTASGMGAFAEVSTDIVR